MTSHSVNDEQALEDVIGEPMDVKGKIAPRLDKLMIEFIHKSPFLIVSTIDANGRIDVSPKGDPCGFVKVDSYGNLLIPERPGNRLAMGFRNILRNSEVGLLFLAPNQRESLRVKGSATLTKDPAILSQLQVNNKPALLCTYVQVTECFMHCGKAVVRSKLWQPDSWEAAEHSIGAQQLAPVLGGGDDDIAIGKSCQILDKAYKDELY